MPEILGSAVIEVGADTAGLRKDVAAGTQQAFSKTDATAKAAGVRAGTGFSGGVIGAIRRNAGPIGAAFGVAGVGAFVKQSVNAEKTFTQTLNTMAAVAKVPQDQIKELSRLALKFGADTVFSAGDAAGAMLELAKGGLTAAQIKAGGLAGTLTLAAAGDVELGEAATFASNAMNTFGLTADKIPAIAAALAGGAAASTASVQSLGQALSQVGPGAKNAGLSLQDTVGTLAAFDQAGIKGSDAGTSLKTMLTRLVPTTDSARKAMAKYNLEFTNTDGSFKNITEIADELRVGLGKLSEEQKVQALTTIFGSDATRAASVLIDNGAKGLGKYIKATKDLNAAQRIAESKQKGTAGALERLSGSYETLQIQVGQAIAPLVIKFADGLDNKVIPAVSKFIKEMSDGTGAGGDFVKVTKDIIDVGKDLAGVAKDIFKAFDSLPGPVKKYGIEIALAAVALGKMNSALAGSRLGLFATDLRNAEGRAARAKVTLQGLGGVLRNVAGAGGLLLMQQGLGQTRRDFNLLETAAGGALSGAALGAFAGPQGAAIGAGIGALAGVTLSLVKGTKDGGDAAKTATPQWQSYADTLNGVAAATTDATRARVIDNFSMKENKKILAGLGLSQRTLVNAGIGRPDAIAAVNKRQREQLDIINAQVEAQEKLALKSGSPLEFQKLATLRAQQKALKDQQAAQRQLLTGVAKEAKEQRRRNALQLTYNDLVKLGVPKQVAQFIDKRGITQDTKAVAALIDKFKIVDETKWKAILTAAGIKPTQDALSQVQTQLGVIQRTRTEAKVTANTNAAIADSKGLIRFISGLTGKVNVGANVEEGKRQANFLRSYISGLTASIPVTGKPAGSLLELLTGGGADGGTITAMAGGGTIPGRRLPYGDKVMIAGAPGEEVTSNRQGQADAWRPVLKAINAGASRDQIAAMVGANTSSRTAPLIGGDLVVQYPAPAALTESLPNVMANLSFLLGGA